MKTREEIEILRSDALAGDAGAQNDLGCAYSSGDGVPKDLKTAFYWFELSAKQGERVAQYNLGRHYHYGLGIEKKDIHKAIEWYEKSANQRYANAAIQLGEIYEKGYKTELWEPQSKHVPNNYVSVNLVEAFYWYQRGTSEEKGRYNLARCYEIGIGTEVNLRKACDLYRSCKMEDAQVRLASILKDFSPVADHPIGSIDILRNNPFRILGVWSNSSNKEIKACQSKIEVMSKIGKVATFETDKTIPCTSADFIELYKERILYAEERLETSTGVSKWSFEYKLNTFKEKLQDWQRDLNALSIIDFSPKRDKRSIEIALQMIATDQERLKCALFWFCNHSPADKEALSLLSGHKWEEAAAIWDKEKNFSAIINRAILHWLDREYYFALSKMLSLTHDEKNRNDFINCVCSDRFKISEKEFSHLFWDALSCFPEDEFAFKDFALDEVKKSYSLGGAHGLMEPVTKDDTEYVKQKVVEILKSPLDQIILDAEKQDRCNLEKCRDAYDKIVQKAPYLLLRIKRVLGEDDYRYKLLCDEVATKLLEFSIYYNNNNKTNWNASHASKYMAETAKKIAYDETIRQRCTENIKVLKQNSDNAQIDKSIESIDSILTQVERDNVTISELKKLPSRLVLYLQVLGGHAGTGSELFKKISDGVVNRMLNIVIKICNNQKDFVTFTEAKSILDELKCLSLSDDVRKRLEKNISIISDNGMAALQRGKIGSFPGHSDDLSFSSHSNSNHTNTKKETVKRRLHKLIATILSAVVIASICYYFNWNGNWEYLSENYPWWLYTCIGILVITVIFVISMWCLEITSDPYDYDIVWIDKAHNSLIEIANGILRSGSTDGKRTYSGPFAFPFECLALIVVIIGYPIKWITKLATLIK